MFFYETNLKRFFKPVVTEDDARVYLCSSSHDLHVFRNYKGVNRFSVYRGCDKLAISNIDEFRDISLDCAAFNIMLCKKRDINEESILYDLTNGENIILKDYEGGIVSPYNIRVFKNENNKRIIALNTNSLSSNNYSIYNLDERKFYLNPITNDYIFHFYRDCGITDDNKITILKVPYCWLISNEIPERNNTLTIDFNEVISEWSIGTLEKDTPVSLVLVTKVLINGTFINIATVNTTTPESDYTNNEANNTTRADPICDLVIIKVVDSKKVYLGEIVSWTIKITNNGPSEALDVKVEDIGYRLSDEDFKEGYAILRKGKKVYHKLEK